MWCTGGAPDPDPAWPSLFVYFIAHSTLPLHRPSGPHNIIPPSHLCLTHGGWGNVQLRVGNQAMHAVPERRGRGAQRASRRPSQPIRSCRVHQVPRRQPRPFSDSGAAPSWAAALCSGCAGLTLTLSPFSPSPLSPRPPWCPAGYCSASSPLSNADLCPTRRRPSIQTLYIAANPPCDNRPCEGVHTWLPHSRRPLLSLRLTN